MVIAADALGAQCLGSTGERLDDRENEDRPEPLFNMPEWDGGSEPTR